MVDNERLSTFVVDGRQLDLRDDPFAVSYAGHGRALPWMGSRPPPPFVFLTGGKHILPPEGGGSVPLSVVGSRRLPCPPVRLGCQVNVTAVGRKRSSRASSRGSANFFIELALARGNWGRRSGRSRDKGPAIAGQGQPPYAQMMIYCGMCRCSQSWRLSIRLLRLPVWARSPRLRQAAVFNRP